LRILIEASGADVAESTLALRQSGHNLAAALIMLKTGASVQEARRLLRDTNGHVYSAINRTGQAPASNSQRPNG
jgi:N-acetylmuramic acid 6-phosphate (MurNAc-6-P) etherase